MKEETLPTLPNVGMNLKKERLQRHWSQDELAEKSGVSKAMLSQLESGKVNPTVGTMWKIAHALGVDFVQLLKGEHRTLLCFEVTRKADQTRLNCEADGVAITVLSDIHLADELEYYKLVFQPGAELRSQPHYTGSEELLYVQQGTVEVTALDRKNLLNEGDVIRFSSDVDHSITNPGKSESILQMIVRFPKTTER